MEHDCICYIKAIFILQSQAALYEKLLLLCSCMVSTIERRGGKASGFSDTQTGAQQSLTAAERMMQKMGWKEGQACSASFIIAILTSTCLQPLSAKLIIDHGMVMQGLGRAGQGMATPLIAKSDGRAGAGVIVNADARRSAAVRPAFSNLNTVCLQCT